MGTSNFHNTNANNIYAVTEGDEFTYEDVRESISIELQETAKEQKIDFFEDSEIDLADELRSFPATSIGELYEDIVYCNTDVRVTLIPKTVSGYYEGFNLDYEIRIEDNNTGISYEFDEDYTSDIIEEHLYNYPEDAGILAIHGKRLGTKIDDVIINLRNVVESTFNRYSDSYVVAAQFSNGETIYTQV